MTHYEKFMAVQRLVAEGHFLDVTNLAHKLGGTRMLDCFKIAKEFLDGMVRQGLLTRDATGLYTMKNV